MGARLIKICLLTLMLTPAMVLALEFKSVAVPKAVLYDAPSSSAKKRYILNQNYPVEVIVNLGDWLKVRDAQGSISWVETKQLANKRTVMVSANQAEIRQAADANANLIATVEKDVLLEVVEAQLTNGWLKVKHRDGLVGYILVTSTWGFQ